MNLPTKLTYLRIFLIPVFLVLYFIPFQFFRFAAMGVFIIASFTDYLDGYIARKENIVTDLGKFLDPIADKMLVACALIAITLEIHMFQIGIAICTMIILSRELMISGFRIVASSKNVVLAADKLGKIKTVLQIFSLILLLPYADIFILSELAAQSFLYIGFAFLILATLMTLVSGINYLIKYRHVLKD